MKYILASVLYLVLNNVQSKNITLKSYCDLGQTSIWWRNISPDDIDGTYRKEECFIDCENVVALKDDNGEIPDD